MDKTLYFKTYKTFTTKSCKIVQKVASFVVNTKVKAFKWPL